MKKFIPVLAAVMILLSSAAPAEGLPALPGEEPGLPAFATMNEARIAGPEPGAVFNTDGNIAVMAMKYGGKYIRLVTELDSHAKDLLTQESEAGTVPHQAFYDYVRELPVSRIEELPGQPLDQAELDALVGKTMRELLREGFAPFAVWAEGSVSRAMHMIVLSFGLYTYTFTFDMTDEDYTNYDRYDYVGDWPVKSVCHDGFSRQALFPDEGSVLPAFATMKDARIAEPHPRIFSYNTDETIAVMAMKYGEKYIRLITELDSHAKDLCMQDPEEEDAGDDPAYEYVIGLPVSRIEELPTLPLDEAELDALVGKTLPELLKEGFMLDGVWAEGEFHRARHFIPMYRGLYTYAFEFDMTDEDYTSYADHGTVGEWPVKSVRCDGFSHKILFRDLSPLAAP